MGTRSGSVAVVLACMLGIMGLTQERVVASETARALSAKALGECHKGRVARAREVRLAHFERGQALAERAVALDDQLADAHFAMFCTMGEKMRLDGEILSSLFGFHKVMAALDRTLELDPGHLDALSCKGTFLIRLPRLFGGDPDKGERLLHRVIQRSPSGAVNARLVLARSYADRGSHERAVTLAREALRIAHSHDRQDLIPEAQETLARLSPEDEALASPPALLARP